MRIATEEAAARESWVKNAPTHIQGMDPGPIAKLTTKARVETIRNIPMPDGEVAVLVSHGWARPGQPPDTATTH